MAMLTDAFDMAIVHRVFRTELHNAPELVRDVEAGDTKRSAIVGDHPKFIVAGLYHPHAAEDVAEVIVNLITSNRFVNGETVVIDGGYSATT